MQRLLCSGTGLMRCLCSTGYLESCGCRILLGLRCGEGPWDVPQVIACCWKPSSGGWQPPTPPADAGGPLPREGTDGVPPSSPIPESLWGLLPFSCPLPFAPPPSAASAAPPADPPHPGAAVPLPSTDRRAPYPLTRPATLGEHVGSPGTVTKS